MARVLGDNWLVPGLDELNREFFTRGTVCIQSCNACQHVQHPPEMVCGRCGSSDSSWRDSAGRGRIESHAVVRHPVHPGLADRCPYVVLVGSLDDVPGVHVVGNLRGDPQTPLSIGQAVTAVFETVEDPTQGSLAIPQWELA